MEVVTYVDMEGAYVVAYKVDRVPSYAVEASMAYVKAGM